MVNTVVNDKKMKLIDLILKAKGTITSDPHTPILPILEKSNSETLIDLYQRSDFKRLVAAVEENLPSGFELNKWYPEEHEGQKVVVIFYKRNFPCFFGRVLKYTVCDIVPEHLKYDIDKIVYRHHSKNEFWKFKFN